MTEKGDAQSGGGTAPSPAVTSSSTDKPQQTAATPPAKPRSYSPEWMGYATLALAGLTVMFGVMWFNATRVLNDSSAAVLPTEDLTTVQKPIEYAMAKPLPVAEMIELPDPAMSGGDRLNESIANRRSRREYAEESVSLADLGQILWAAQGETDDAGHRAAPSAKGAYPYTLYVVVRDVDGLEPGLYQYFSDSHSLGDLSLANAGEMLVSAGVQENSQVAPVVIAMAASKAKMVEVFPDSNPDKNTYLEGGHIGQNIYLTVESLGMSTVVTGGFNSMAVGEALGLDSAEEVVYLVPLGNRVTEEATE